ncbi:DUF3426 domain-containing protein [Microbulbifer aggregans]|uniref:DUF3426 domain-containing protein n=1 Tax=Microbulbifer aggregans TaxID=1769779 RepID=UPI001CFE77E0|nr:DUF3426 domain-containing protein [Microbulbifer aggregans]
MSQLVTRCPHCSTSFHVSEPQLRAARGAVRCGSCLQVFRADENIVFNEDDPQPASKKAIDELLDDDDFLIHDDIELDGDDSQDDGTDLPKAKASSRNSKQQDKPAKREPEQQPLIDDAFGEQQWQELDTPADEEDDLVLGEDLDAARDELWAEEMAMEAPLESAPPKQSSSPHDESLPGEIFEDDWSDGVRRDSLDSLIADSEDTVDLLGTARIHREPEQTPVDDDHIDSQQRDQAPLLPRDQLISAIGSAPIEVNWQPKRHNRVPGWLWGLSAFLLLIALAAQTAYFRFDTLSKREPWRQMYAVACPVFGCKLPAQVDISAIHTSNLVVRSHPQTAGALAVEAVLLNRAPFEQPFPDLVLRFTDLKNAPVASRRFKPADYLKGELAGRRLMPSGNPVHIALDIVDPGTEAVNYELEIAPR